MKDIEIVDIDYTGVKPEYRKEDKFNVTDMSGVFIIPEEGPFYGDSLRLIKGGLPLQPGKDYNPVSQDTELTVRTGKKVYLHVEVKDHIVSAGGDLQLVYQRVGMPVISVKTLLKLLEEMAINGGTIDFSKIENLPKTFYPAQHSHDIQSKDELVGFGGLVELMQLLTYNQLNGGGQIVALLEGLQKELFDKLNYQQKLLWGMIMGHARDYTNPHDLTPGDVDAGLIPNCRTATPTQDLEGLRDDLYSTPAGLKAVLEGAEPETDNFIIQNELPFSYYGSGMYLPPPIAGSFEGLGGDVENSAFCLEGNGWTVGLIRGYDSRVKNLYYVYHPDLKSRDNKAWQHTYVQYRHPTIDAAKARAGFVMCGSGAEVLGVVDTDQHKAWICASNSTFDPSAHDFKELNIEGIASTVHREMFSNFGQPGTISLEYYGRFNISRMGDWVYLIFSSNYVDPSEAEGDDNGVNFTQYFFRFPYSKLTDKNVKTIDWEPVRLNFDNLLRERYTNQTSFRMARRIRNAEGRYTSFMVKYSPAASFAQSHRKRQFIVRGSPSDKAKARIKIMAVIYSGYIAPGTAVSNGLWKNICVDYDFNTDTNTLTIDPNWVMPTHDLPNDKLVWASPAHEKRNDIWWAGTHIFSFENVCQSWIPGYGFVSMCTKQTGPPPYTFAMTQMNQWLDPRRDYEAIWQDINLRDVTGSEKNTWYAEFNMASPFGFAGFPRYHTDVYNVGGKIQANPIEIFVAEADNQKTNAFYRQTAPGGLNYEEHTNLQSPFIKLPIKGRKTTSNFGKVIGFSNNMGQVNYPNAPNKSHTRQIGLFSRSVVKAHGPVTSDKFTETLQEDGTVGPIRTDADGGILIPLITDHVLDSVNRTLTLKPNKANTLYIPEAVHHTFIQQQIGARFNDVIEYHYTWYIASEPHRDRVPRSMYHVIFHYRDEPDVARCVAGVCNWVPNGKSGAGYDVMELRNNEQPFTGPRYGDDTLSIYKTDHPDNMMAKGRYVLNKDNVWEVVYPNEQTNTQMNRMEIYPQYDQSPTNITQCLIPGYRLTITGNADIFRLWYDVRNSNGGVALDAVITFRPGGAFREFDWMIWLCPDKNIGWCHGVNAEESGGAMGMWVRWNTTTTYVDRISWLVNGRRQGNGVDDNGYGDGGPVVYFPPTYIACAGAVFTEGNWTIFVNSDVNVTFNGYSMTAGKTMFDLEEVGVPYKNTTFYIYCQADGSSAKYELTKVLRSHNSYSILVAIIKTNESGIATIDREQNFAVSGFSLTRERDAGIPVSSGSILEQGTYRFLKRDELYKD